MFCLKQVFTVYYCIVWFLKNASHSRCSKSMYKRMRYGKKRFHCMRGGSARPDSSEPALLHGHERFRPVRKPYQRPGCQARSVPPISQPGTQRSLQTEQWLAGPRRPPPAKTSVTRTSPLFPTWWRPQSSDLYSEPAAARDRNIPATAATWPSLGTDLRLLGWDPAFLLFCFWWSPAAPGGTTAYLVSGMLNSGGVVGFIHMSGVLEKSSTGTSWKAQQAGTSRNTQVFSFMHFHIFHGHFSYRPEQCPLTL